MSKKQQKPTPSNEEFEDLLRGEPAKEPVFNCVTIGITKDENGYNVIKIPYDSTLGVTGKAEILESHYDHTVITGRFKFHVIEQGVFNR